MSSWRARRQHFHARLRLNAQSSRAEGAPAERPIYSRELATLVKDGSLHQIVEETRSFSIEICFSSCRSEAFVHQIEVFALLRHLAQFLLEGGKGSAHATHTFNFNWKPHRPLGTLYEVRDI